MLPSEKPEYPPLLPEGLHVVTLDELMGLCVGRFEGLSATRAMIMERLVDVAQRLENNGIGGDLWVDGSLLTEKAEPADSDVVLFIPSAHLEGLNPEQEQLLEWLTSPDPLVSHLCHAYVAVSYPPEHPDAGFGQAELRSWRSFFGRNRSNDYSKGHSGRADRGLARGMSRIFDLQQMLEETGATLRQLERAMAANPVSRSLPISMRSLQKRYLRLERDFLAVTSELGLDVLSYRVFQADRQPPAASVAHALIDFQDLFSVVYQAIRDRQPKKTRHVDAEAARDSTFGWAYAFSGSVGVVLTLPNDRLLFDEAATALDGAMQSIAAMAKAATPEQVVQFSRTLGAGPVRALYTWASDHAKAGIGADIEWRRGEHVRAAVVVQEPELERLKRTIEITSDSVDADFEFDGDLVGADTVQRTFHMKSGDTEIRGRLGDAIGPEHPLVLDRPYHVQITRTTKVYYSTEREETSHVLQNLRLLE